MQDKNKSTRSQDHGIAMPALHGVVLAGGMSRRMGRDKALLTYDGQTSQLERVAAILSSVCESVEAACRADQAAAWPRLANLTFRVDAYPAWGPLAGILTALKAHPRCAVLAVACDLPFLTSEIIAELVRGRRPGHWATTFSHADGVVEPLCTIYEPEAGAILLSYMATTGRRSPREALQGSGVVRLPLQHPEVLINVNAPDEYARARALIQGSRGESLQDHP